MSSSMPNAAQIHLSYLVLPSLVNLKSFTWGSKLLPQVKDCHHSVHHFLNTTVWDLEVDSLTWFHTIPTSYFICKSRDAILKWPKLSIPWLCLKILSMKITNRTGNKAALWCSPLVSSLTYSLEYEPSSHSSNTNTRCCLVMARAPHIPTILPYTPPQKHPREHHHKPSTIQPHNAIRLDGQTPKTPSTSLQKWRASLLFHNQDGI